MKPLYIAKVLQFFLLVFSSLVAAQDYIYLGAWSHHFSDHPNSDWEDVNPSPDNRCWRYDACIIGSRFVEHQFNETHNLIGYQTRGLMIGHYKNSFYQSTVVVTKNFEVDFNSLSLILALGVTHGYTDCNYQNKPGDAELCPHYQAGVVYTRYRLQPMLSVSGKVMTFGFRYKI